MASTERFGYEWNKFPRITKDYETQFLRWTYPLTPLHFKGKTVLDAGCGTGRNSIWPLRYGAKKVVGFDFDKRTVRVARRNLNPYTQSRVDYASIYDIDYEEEFDITFSIGVIHHLEKPVQAVKNITKATKKGGKILIWVYGYEGNEWIVRYINPLRKITSRLPPQLTNLIAYFLSVPYYIYLKIIPQTHPYHKQLGSFRFWHVHSIVLDQLLPRIAHYWKESQARALLERCGLKNIKTYQVNKNSWTAVGTK